MKPEKVIQKDIYILSDKVYERYLTQQSVYWYSDGNKVDDLKVKELELCLS